MHPFMHQINITHRCGDRYRERRLADTGLAGCQIPYLLTLYRHPGITQDELAQELNVNKSSVTRQIAALEDNGYVRRETGTDRRMQTVYATEKALALENRLRTVLRDWSDYLTQDFTDAQRETLSNLMNRIAARAESYMKGVND